MLKADQILPEGLCAGKIQEDDLLLEANGQNIAILSELEDVIDDSSIKVLVRRHGQDHEATLDVKDLFTSMPYRILQFAGSELQDLRYDVAIAHTLLIRAVVLSVLGGCFHFDDAYSVIITHFDNRSTPDLNTFSEVA